MKTIVAGILVALAILAEPTVTRKIEAREQAQAVAAEAARKAAVRRKDREDLYAYAARKCEREGGWACSITRGEQR